ncbi:MAG: aminotransferase class V-fold PLP-dependent enzyme, partial [Cyclobacteriaceae bacterium]|nr:aminotransferase class V-fold PLP-dependent enzyme [Cyclobacteriaceae bacterium]
NEMGVENITKREEELLEIIWDNLKGIPNLHILAGEHKERLGIISFYIDGLHYNVGVKLLNDKFGIQTRGGCSCAGTYGHYLLNVLPEESKLITDLVNHGDCSTKPGWIRMSVHPTTTNNEAQYLVESIHQLALNHKTWIKDYDVDHTNNIISHKRDTSDEFIKSTIDKSFDKKFY